MHTGIALIANFCVQIVFFWHQMVPSKALHHHAHLEMDLLDTLESGWLNHCYMSDVMYVTVTVSGLPQVFVFPDIHISAAVEKMANRQLILHLWALGYWSKCQIDNWFSFVSIRVQKQKTLSNTPLDHKCSVTYSHGLDSYLQILYANDVMSFVLCLKRHKSISISATPDVFQKFCKFSYCF